MPDTPTLALFAAAALALLVIPGPSVLFIVARSLERGRRAGLVCGAPSECACLRAQGRWPSSRLVRMRPVGGCAGLRRSQDQTPHHYPCHRQHSARPRGAQPPSLISPRMAQHCTARRAPALVRRNAGTARACARAHL